MPLLDFGRMEHTMPTSSYFASRADYYRRLAESAPRSRCAECQLELANLFLQLSFDLRLMEEADAHIRASPPGNLPDPKSRNAEN